MADVLGWLKRNKEERELSISVWLSRPCWSVLLTSSPNQAFFPQCNKENDACSKFLMKQGTGRKLIRAYTAACTAQSQGEHFRGKEDMTQGFL